MDGTKIDSETLLKSGCAHLTGLVALTAGPCVCLVHLRELLEEHARDEIHAKAVAAKLDEVAAERDEYQRANVSLRDALESVRNELGGKITDFLRQIDGVRSELEDALDSARTARIARDRLAGDALAALSGAGVGTPAEGYVASPHLLRGDILKLVDARHSATVAAYNHTKERERHLDMSREAAEKALIDQREVLLNLKAERDSKQVAIDKLAQSCARITHERDQYRLDAIQADKELDALKARWNLAIELLKTLGGAP